MFVFSGGQADDCTSGFMSLDRMNAVLDNYDSNLEKCDVDGLALLPAINFSCNGVIFEIVFGADWAGNTDSFTELQIWRPVSGIDGLYTLVESTTIITEENTTQLYHYPLSSPLPFQAGDVLGYYQTNDCRLTFLYEKIYGGGGHQLYYFTHHDNTQTTINTHRTRSEHQFHLLLDVVTGLLL